MITSSLMWYTTLFTFLVWPPGHHLLKLLVEDCCVFVSSSCHNLVGIGNTNIIQSQNSWNRYWVESWMAGLAAALWNSFSSLFPLLRQDSCLLLNFLDNLLRFPSPPDYLLLEHGLPPESPWQCCKAENDSSFMLIMTRLHAANWHSFKLHSDKASCCIKLHTAHNEKASSCLKLHTRGEKILWDQFLQGWRGITFRMGRIYSTPRIHLTKPIKVALARP